MKKIHFTNKLMLLIWTPMVNMVDVNFKVRSLTRSHLERSLHDKLEDRIKFKVMIPIEWRMNTPL